jgi:hypothetical protein
VIEPNRLSLPGEAAARERVEVVFKAIDGMTPERLHGVVLSPRDGDERDRLVGTLEGAVAAAGRDELLDEARNSVRNALYQRLTVIFPAGIYGISMHMTGRATDQVELVAAIDDAVSVAVAEDLLDPADVRALSEPGRALLGLPPVGGDDADGGHAGGRHLPWEPTATDWAEAQGAAGIDPDAPLPGERGLRLFLFGAIALFGIPVAIGAGIANDQVVLGVLAALAIGAVCWTFATFRRAR